MGTGRRAGRPRSASREMLEEAACELFLEKGYGATSVADITQRAGVSRNTFFNYIPTKSDLLWTSVDDALEALAADLAATGRGDGPRAAVAEVRDALLRLAAGMEPGTVVLAFANAEPMGVTEELEESAARRQGRAGQIIAAHLRRRGAEDLAADVLGRAHAGAFLAALRAWSRSAVPREPFPDILARALDTLGPLTR
ncbi:TetR family transcriptional regulator [Georgenia soli]|uniref:TetR family transcriptional regulator n=1 Tax=Georgenia soli TaxID=638953 RepID=A0A2A9EKV1_9MICO|nr:TetR/AcrR family transcriptional regulator [Georgenia soli]PFG39717.1 TetR family transcriptional regulator [Georgenia soli]